MMYNCTWAKDNLGKGRLFLGASVAGYIDGNRCEYIGTWGQVLEDARSACVNVGPILNYRL